MEKWRFFVFVWLKIKKLWYWFNWNALLLVWIVYFYIYVHKYITKNVSPIMELAVWFLHISFLTKFIYYIKLNYWNTSVYPLDSMSTYFHKRCHLSVIKYILIKLFFTLNYFLDLPSDVISYNIMYIILCHPTIFVVVVACR